MAIVEHLAKFWDDRYSHEGAIWGDSPSPTARIAAECLMAEGLGTQRPETKEILDVGFGYGRDVAFLLQQGFNVSGVELSHEGQQRANERFGREKLHASNLIVGEYTETLFPAESFDGILSHRMAHLLTTEDEIEAFARVSARLLQSGGVLCVGARDTRDLAPADMWERSPEVYEYKHRPGHLIRYWDSSGFQRVFGSRFDILQLHATEETESIDHPVPCHLTIMIARKR